MVRNYEAMFIVSTSAEAEDQLTPIMEKYRQLIVENGGEVVQFVKWDKRRLAYEVKGQREGLFLLLNFKSESKVANELDRVFRISDEVMRHIIVRPDEKHLVQPAKAEAPVAHEVEVVEQVEPPAEPEEALEVTEPVEAAEAETSEEVEIPEAEAAAEDITEAEAPSEEEASVETKVSGNEEEEAV